MLARKRVRKIRRVPVLEMPSWLCISYGTLAIRWSSNQFTTLFEKGRKNPRVMCVELIGEDLMAVFEGTRESVEFQKLCGEICARRVHLSLSFILNNTVPKWEHVQVCHLLRKNITFDQYRGFLRAFFRFLIPRDFLGHVNFDKFVDSAAENLFNLGRGELVQFKNYFAESLGLRSSKVNWLKALTNGVHKETAFRKIAVWILWLAAAVTRASFYVTDVRDTNRLMFFRKDVWMRISDRSFELLKWERKLSKMEDLRLPLSPQTFFSRIRFSPKGVNCRPLMIPPFTKDARIREKSAMAKVIGLIDSLCLRSQRISLTGAALPAFDNFYKRLRLFGKRATGKKIYAVKTDLMQCFDRIDQNTLRGVLRNMIDPEKYYKFDVRRRREAKRKLDVLPPNRKRKAETRKKMNLAQKFLREREREALRRLNFDEVSMRGREALQIIEEAVFQRKIVYKKEVYMASRGIPQGTSVSTRLCNLYLGAMENAYFADALRGPNTVLIRYVDDYMMLTTEESIAQNFLKKLICGVEDYGMMAKAEKTVINFSPPLSELSESMKSVKVIPPNGCFTWCGYEVYPKQCKISVDDSKLNTSSVYMPHVRETRMAKNKRVHIMTYAKAALQKRATVLLRSTRGRWKAKSMNRLRWLAVSLYGRSLAKKHRLTYKGPRNRIFMNCFGLWVRFGFDYNRHLKIARLFKPSSF